MRVDKTSFDLNFNPLWLKIINLLLAKIGYFTVIVGSETGVELVLIHRLECLKFSLINGRISFLTNFSKFVYKEFLCTTEYLPT